MRHRIIAIALLIFMLLPMITACDINLNGGGDANNGGSTAEPPADNPTSNQAAYDEYVKYDLGVGINAITGIYLDKGSETFKTNEFLNREVVSSLYSLGHRNVQGTEVDSFHASDVHSFATQFSQTYTSSAGANLGIGGDDFGFSTTFSNKFSVSTDFNWKSTTKQYYSLSYQKFIDQSVYMINFDAADVKETEGAISAYALNKLAQMQDLSGAALDAKILQFFDSMGTHIVTDAKYGGKIEVYYYTVTNNTEWSADAATELESTVKMTMEGGVANGGANAGSSLDISLGLKSSDENTIAKLFTVAMGGNALNAYTYSEFNAAYAQWIADFNARDDHLTMVDIEQLCPIWELLPAEYASIANRMKELFTEEIQAANSDFLKQFEFENVIENESTTDFAGGNGTADYPYLIAEPRHLANMDDFDREDGSVHFRLIDDIDLKGTDFTSIDSFRGVLDGDNHAIKNWVMPAVTDGPSNTLFLGFIKENHGTIKNLKMEYDEQTLVIDYSLDDNTHKPSNWWAHAGVLVAVNRESGIITNCGVSNAKIHVDQEYRKGMSGTLGLLVGALAGENFGQISYSYSQNCNIHGRNAGDWADRNAKIITSVGALVGKNQSNISYVYSRDNIVSGIAKGGCYQYEHFVYNFISALIGENTEKSIVKYAIVYDYQVSGTNEDYNSSDDFWTTVFHPSKAVHTKHVGAVCAQNNGTIECFATLAGDDLQDSVVAHGDGTHPNHFTKNSVAEFLEISEFMGHFIIDKNGQIWFGSIKK